MKISQLPPLIGHRGCQQAPENTLAAFRKASDQGARAIELDVQCSADGELVICHDDRLERTTNGRGRLTEQNWRELSKLDAGSWFSPEYQGERLPLLGQALELARQRGLHVFIEIKEGPRTANFLPRLLDTLHGSQDVHVVSFDRQILQQVREADPSLKTGVLLSEQPMLRRLKQAALAGTATGVAAAAGAAMWGHPWLAAGAALLAPLVGTALGYAQGRKEILHDALQQPDTVLPFWLGVDRGFVDQLSSRGIACIPYTADNPALISRLHRAGCPSIITDNPGPASDPA